MEPHKIDWVGAFLFSYWNLKRKRTEEAKVVDGFILEFFKNSRPPMLLGASFESVSWGEALFDLMRQLNAQSGCAPSDPHGTRHSPWLPTDFCSSIPGKSRPFVNWVGVEACTQILDDCGDTSQAMEQLLEHMTSVYELQVVNTPNLTISEYWSGNLHLKAFERRHYVQPWGVPIPSPVEGPRRLSWLVHDTEVICSALEGPGSLAASVSSVFSSYSIRSCFDSQWTRKCQDVIFRLWQEGSLATKNGGPMG